MNITALYSARFFSALLTKKARAFRVRALKGAHMGGRALGARAQVSERAGQKQ